jgi:hypothetical protein
LRVVHDAIHFLFQDLVDVTGDAEVIIADELRGYRIDDGQGLRRGVPGRPFDKGGVEAFLFYPDVGIVGDDADEFAGGELGEGGRGDDVLGMWGYSCCTFLISVDVICVPVLVVR